VGKSVEEAVWWFITMDRSCQAQLLAEAAGKPTCITHEAAMVARGQVGNEMAGWFQFQPLWQKIVREEPDCLE
jgi:ribulose-5-phosphate 4-epimerase/fuculose-1-phosphate aldolase